MRSQERKRKRQGLSCLSPNQVNVYRQRRSRQEERQASKVGIMPFKSRQQQKFMYAVHPKIAARWQKETPKGTKLPKRKKKKK